MLAALAATPRIAAAEPEPEPPTPNIIINRHSSITSTDRLSAFTSPDPVPEQRSTWLSPMSALPQANYSRSAPTSPQGHTRESVSTPHVRESVSTLHVRESSNTLLPDTGSARASTSRWIEPRASTSRTGDHSNGGTRKSLPGPDTEEDAPRVRSLSFSIGSQALVGVVVWWCGVVWCGVVWCGVV